MVRQASKNEKQNIWVMGSMLLTCHCPSPLLSISLLYRFLNEACTSHYIEFADLVEAQPVKQQSESVSTTKDDADKLDTRSQEI